MKHDKLFDDISRVTAEYCSENEVSFEEFVDIFSMILLAASPFENIKIEFDGDNE